jgi:hypothetical protein
MVKGPPELLVSIRWQSDSAGSQETHPKWSCRDVYRSKVFDSASAEDQHRTINVNHSLLLQKSTFKDESESSEVY